MTANSIPEDDTDEFFGFVVGLYAAALATPAVLIGVVLGATTDPGVLFFALLGTAVPVAGAVGWVARRESLAVGLGKTRWAWAAMGLPFLYFGVPIAGGATLPDPAVPIAVLGALVGVVGGVGLVAASHNRHAKAMLADAEELADFRAAAPERDRRLAKWVAVGLFVAGIVGLAGSALLDFEPLRWLFQMAIPTGAGLYGTTSERRVTVSDAGLVVGNPAHKRFRPWSAYESYSVDDETIAVHRAGWSARGLRDLRRDAREVADPEAVASALGSHLPERRPR